MVRCVQCQGDLPPDAISEGMAFCPHCKHVFPCSPATTPHAPRPMPAFVPRDAFDFDVQVCERVMAEMPPPPSSVKAALHPDGIRLVLPWRLEATRAGGRLVFAGFTVLMVACYLFTDDPDRGETVTFALFTGAFLYAWLLTEWNRTVVRLNPRGVTITHGPLPTWNTRQHRAWKALRHLSIEDHTRRLRGGSTVTTYNLMNGTSDVLTRGWHRADTLRYIKTLIEHTAHTQSTSAAGAEHGGR